MNEVRKEKLQKQIIMVKKSIEKIHLTRSKNMADKQLEEYITSSNSLIKELEERINGKVYCPCCLAIPQNCACSKDELLNCALQLDDEIEDYKALNEKLLMDRLDNLEK